MIATSMLRSIFLTLALTSALAGCATYRKCGFSGCPGDAAISAQVRVLFNQHAALEPPNLIGIETLDHVVYLTGLVDTDLERRIAQSVALQADGVARVVNSIELRDGSIR
jgi:osmotically-inducible protein OsmY